MRDAVACDRCVPVDALRVTFDDRSMCATLQLRNRKSFSFFCLQLLNDTRRRRPLQVSAAESSPALVCCLQNCTFFCCCLTAIIRRSFIPSVVFERPAHAPSSLDAPNTHFVRVQLSGIRGPSGSKSKTTEDEKEGTASSVMRRRASDAAGATCDR